MTGTKGPASLMLQCRHCEDQNLQSLHPKVSGSKDWVCARCSDALEQTGGDLSANPFTNIGLKSLRNVDSYSCEIFGGNWFVPAPELGAGWSQARRKHKSGLKNWFLSPLGYEVTSREDAASQSSYEEEINRNLYDARAAEFQAQQMKSNKSSQQVKDVKKTARHNRKRNEYQSPEKALIKSTEEESTIDFGKLEDEGRICTGKLYNFVIPDGFCLKWFVCSDETDIISRFEQNLDISNQLESRVPLEVNALPSSGFFGLEITAIRSRMEGLENSINCKQYRYLDAVKCAEQILDELRSATRRFEAINSSQDKLNKCLLKERWKIERELVYPAVPPTYFSNSDKSLAHKVGFRELFPSVISSEQGELLLCLWEYLYHNHVTSKVMDTLSMYDLISSLIPSGSVLPTYGQVVFDEVCCMLVDVLYLQIRKNVSHIFHGPMDEECNWNSTMAVRPMNILTWPHLALEAIRILSFPLLPLETSKVLERPLDLIKCPQRDLLCLLFNHPLIDQFLVLVPDEHVHSQSLNAASGTLRFMKEFFSNPDAYSKPITDDNAESMLFRSIGPFSSALRTLFRDITTIEGLDDTRRLFSANILSWLNDLCKRWDILDEAAAYSSTDLAQQLDVDSLVFNSKRFWGGYTLSGISLAKEDLLLPSCFNKVQKSQYVEKMAMLLMLEKYMLLVSKSEPDDWSTADRAVVYAVLLDQCITVSDFTAPQITKYEQTTKKFNQVDDIPIAPSKVVDLPIIDVHKSGEPDLTCHFSGLSFSTDNSIKWVYVPSEYQQYPIEEVSTNTTSCLTSSSSQLTTDTSSQTAVLRGSRLSNTFSGGTMRAPVALLTVMCKLIAARELATNDASRYEERVSNYMRNTITDDPKTSSIHKHLSGRGGPNSFFSPSLLSQPLGFDRNGSSYWLLSVQEYSTLFPYTTSGQASFRTIGNNGVQSMNVIEPCVLIREPNGWWGFHCGIDVKTLFDSFSDEVPHEKRLRLRMIERIAMTRCVLRKGTLYVNMLQREWIDRRSRCETWLLNQTKIPDIMSTQQKNLYIELVWGRSVEVRQLMHFSGVYRYEDDPQTQSTVRAEREGLQRKQKKLRDSCLEDSFDLHPARGWRRDDPLTPIRMIAASCTATRLIADPSIYQIYQQVTRRSVGVFGKRTYPLLEKNMMSPSTIVWTASEDPQPVVPSVASTGAANRSSSAPAPDNELKQSAIPAVDAMDMDDEPDVITVPSIVTDGVNAHNDKKNDSAADIVALDKSCASAVEDDRDDQSMIDAEDLIDQMDVVNDAIQFMINNEEDISLSMVVSEGTKIRSDAWIEAVNAIPYVVSEEKNVTEMEINDASDGDQKQAQPVIDGVSKSTEKLVVGADDDVPVEEVVEDKFPFIDSNGMAILPNLKMLISSESSGKPYPPNVRCKSIELLHLITGEVIQIFPAGKDAATYFGISQSGISLCLHDIKPDYYGFKWKVYDGPVINFPYLSRFQFPLPAIIQMQVTKHQKVEHYSIEDERRRVAHVFETDRLGS